VLVRSLRLGFLLTAFTFFSLGAFAQATTSLSGHVTDKSGAVVPGPAVKLTLTSTGATRTGATNGTDEFQFAQLAPGKYDLVISAPDFLSEPAGR
jgi:hypothetical protein